VKRHPKNVHPNNLSKKVMRPLDFDPLYRSGVIGAWYLRGSQLQFYRMLTTMKQVVAKCHRRFGKGTTVLTHAVERCLTERIIVRYGAETQTQAYQIFEFLMDKIFGQCPKFKPRLTKGYYEFYNGSRVYIFGVRDSGEIDKARGTEAHIIICDEFGFWKYKAEYILKSILQPQLLETDGQMIITSTPPEDLTHYYISRVVDAEAGGFLFNWTIEDSVRVGEKTREDLKGIIEDCGGEDSVHYRREYLCELIPTKERLVIPEGQNEELYVGSMTRPEYAEFYVCMDLGLIDHTAVLFAYLDFKGARLIIEREYYSNYQTTSELVASCKEIEKNLGYKTVYRRIGDCEMQQLWDMSNDHGYIVSPISKRSSQSGRGFRDSVINQLRLGIQDKKILIDPKCINTIQQVKFGIWNDKRTDFERTDGMGHLDALMALCYLYDNISWDRNPYPSKYAGLTATDHFIGPEELKRRGGQLEVFKKLKGI
jgi:hypothetical protein